MKLTKGGRKDIYNHVTKDLCQIFPFYSSKNPGFHKNIKKCLYRVNWGHFPQLSQWQKASVTWIDSY